MFKHTSCRGASGPAEEIYRCYGARTPWAEIALAACKTLATRVSAGAALPAETDDAYIQKVIAAGGFGRHERNHLNALAATFAPHFAQLPPEIVRLVVEYAFHVGDY